MGSSQSSPTVAATTPSPATTSDQPVPSSTDTAASTTAASASASAVSSSKPKRTGIDLVNHKCRKKKAAYDKCVSVFYREQFLQGKGLKQEDECGALFDTYRQCYLKHLKREFFDKGDKKPKEGSILAEELLDDD